MLILCNHIISLQKKICEHQSKKKLLLKIASTFFGFFSLLIFITKIVQLSSLQIFFLILKILQQYALRTLFKNQHST
jgi:hypothetical protein